MSVTQKGGQVFQGQTADREAWIAEFLSGDGVSNLNSHDAMLKTMNRHPESIEGGK